MNKGLIYLIQPSELVGTERYKIGMSNNPNLDRCKNGYKKGSRYICIMECIEPLKLEGNIKKQFNEKFKLIAGNEYYEGNEKDILNTFNNLVMEYNNSFVVNKKFDKFDYKNSHEDDIDIDKIKEEFKNYRENIEFGGTKKLIKMVYSCHKYNKEYQTNTGLWKHNKNHHKIYENKIDENKKHNDDKTKNQNDDKIYKCKYCKKCFRHNQSRWVHSKKCEETNKMSLTEQIKTVKDELDKFKGKMYFFRGINVYIKESDGTFGELYGTFQNGKFKKLQKEFDL